MLMLDRRQAFASLVASAGALATVTPVFAQTWSPQALTPAQARALDAYAEVLIPTTDTPGGRAAGVPQFIDRALANFCGRDDAAAIRSALDRLDQDSTSAYGAPFATLTAGQQTALMIKWDAESSRALALLKEYATVGYFTSEPGARQALRYDAVPGAYRGNVPLREIGRAWAL